MPLHRAMSSGHMQVVELCLTQQDLPDNDGEGMVCMPGFLQTLGICSVLCRTMNAIVVYQLCDAASAICMKLGLRHAHMALAASGNMFPLAQYLVWLK